MFSHYFIRPLDLDADINKIFNVIMNPNEQFNLRGNINANSIEIYRDQLTNKLGNQYHDFDVIEVDGRFAGFIATYDFQTVNIKAMIYIESAYRNGKLGLVGIDYLNRIFLKYNIDKVYTEVYAYNEHSIKYHKQFGFQEEGRLIDYRYFAGRYWDLIFYSISRNSFYSKYSSVIDRFLKKNV